eukprot:CAMPEP_0170231294 /NCGR_PEP_ID=MMETSP0116_2-20130129/15380_1 /TAXON_ID=400756 /ORGANISM="Durinskia baltica, Strain CSIRO CS-38" /LENGTH=402 /DNA_ID=CAMNT_0010482063 /DNA_START=126 /DNA_END=1331 /DNA_ORIENTATION=-
MNFNAGCATIEEQADGAQLTNDFFDLSIFACSLAIAVIVGSSSLNTSRPKTGISSSDDMHNSNIESQSSRATGPELHEDAEQVDDQRMFSSPVRKAHDFLPDHAARAATVLVWKSSMARADEDSLGEYVHYLPIAPQVRRQGHGKVPDAQVREDHDQGEQETQESQAPARGEDAGKPEADARIQGEARHQSSRSQVVVGVDVVGLLREPLHAESAEQTSDEQGHVLHQSHAQCHGGERDDRRPTAAADGRVDAWPGQRRLEHRVLVLVQRQLQPEVLVVQPGPVLQRVRLEQVLVLVQRHQALGQAPPLVQVDQNEILEARILGDLDLSADRVAKGLAHEQPAGILTELLKENRRALKNRFDPPARDATVAPTKEAKDPREGSVVTPMDSSLRARGLQGAPP